MGTERRGALRKGPDWAPPSAPSSLVRIWEVGRPKGKTCLVLEFLCHMVEVPKLERKQGTRCQGPPVSEAGNLGLVSFKGRGTKEDGGHRP